MDSQFFFTSQVNEANVIYTINAIKDSYYNGATKLNLYISSPGGDIVSGFRLFDFLKSIPMEVNTIGFGLVASSAVTIFLAGVKRKCTRSSTFFLHEGNYTNSFQQTHHKILSEIAKIAKHDLDKTIDIITSVTGKQKNKIVKYLEESSILNATQAKSLNIVHDIITELPLLRNNQVPSPQTPPPASQTQVPPTIPNPPNQPGVPGGLYQ